MNNSMKFCTIFSLLLCCVTMACMVTGCKVGTIGNGKVDVIEGAVFRVAVGRVLDRRPELSEPAQKVTGALLEVMNETETVDLAAVDAKLAERVAALNLPPSVRESFSRLVDDIRSHVIEHIVDSGGSAANAAVVVHDLVQIVNDVSTSRLTT
ncbi:hypothetical protein [Desulfuromonas acetoxidans]|uniref:hypothetical protein n=1 Tax=Desulfuromonas acetoxidans TaxID=891 RepID=UPI00292DEC38|nr:hypothetical protein [Desulfuromonas acetoxidans]